MHYAHLQVALLFTPGGLLHDILRSRQNKHANGCFALWWCTTLGFCALEVIGSAVPLFPWPWSTWSSARETAAGDTPDSLSPNESGTTKAGWIIAVVSSGSMEIGELVHRAALVALDSTARILLWSWTPGSLSSGHKKRAWYSSQDLASAAQYSSGATKAWECSSASVNGSVDVATKFGIWTMAFLRSRKRQWG